MDGRQDSDEEEEARDPNAVLTDLEVCKAKSSGASLHTLRNFGVCETFSSTDLIRKVTDIGGLLGRSADSTQWKNFGCNRPVLVSFLFRMYMQQQHIIWSIPIITQKLEFKVVMLRNI
nr:bifunctional aspartokinase/homoserine dehydrogenase 1-like isoform X1 [Ipomoea batatas]GMD79759.1 bifunctional aspartokinase/homoserine dehydrogenase 1-like isoform X1 [Ipomoea batatas]GME13930.1 bifunctional aspartokinase/homoserine dehydrogenase 1-like isoform X1 [Ipomoea batatas]